MDRGLQLRRTLKPSVKRATFLAAYEACGNILRASKAAGWRRSAHYEALKDSPEYRCQFEAATERAIALSKSVGMSDEAFVRAMAHALRLEARRLLKGLKKRDC